MAGTSGRRRVVDRFAVREQDDAEPASLHCLDTRPAADATIRLNGLVFRAIAGALNPYVPDHGTIRVQTHMVEVAGGVHP